MAMLRMRAERADGIEAMARTDEFIRRFLVHVLPIG